MEQIILEEFKPPYRYIIDSCSINAQKENRNYRRSIYKSLWINIEDYIKSGIIVTCSEIWDEIRDREIKDWLVQNKCRRIDIDEDIQRFVRKIVTEHPKMIRFADRASSSGDPFLLATAIRHQLVIITEEGSKKYQLPCISKFYNVDTVNIIGLCTRENWVF